MTNKPADLLSLMASGKGVFEYKELSEREYRRLVELAEESLGARMRLDQYLHLQAAEKGSVSSSYVVLSSASRALQRVLVMNSYAFDDVEQESVKYLLRRLEDLQSGLPPDEAFKVKASRGGGRQTVPAQMKKKFKSTRDMFCAVLVARLMRRGSTLDEASEIVAEHLKGDDDGNEFTVRGWYSKYAKSIPEQLIEREERIDPDMVWLKMIPPENPMQ